MRQRSGMRDVIRRFARTLPLLLACLPLAACQYDPPPADFDVMPPATPRQPADDCPDLDGVAVDLADDPLGTALADREPPESHGLPMRLAIRRGATHQELWWTVPREDLLAFARDLRARSPQRYGQWRELVLRGSLPGSRAWDRSGWLAEVAKLGPPGPVYAGIVGYRCEGYWARAREQGMRHADGATTERELWLARDRGGDLLLRDAIVRLKPFGVWGDAINHLRSGPSSTWRRIPTVAAVSTEKPAESELPPAAPVPRESATRCVRAPERLVTFSQRILAALPRGVSLAAFLPQSPTDGAPRHCTLLVIEVAFEGPSPDALAAMDALLRRDPDVRSLDLLPTPADTAPARRRLRVVLR